MPQLFNYINKVQLVLLPLAALTLAVVSGFFEYVIFEEIIGSIIIAIATVASLEILKILIILYSSIHDEFVKKSLRRVFHIFRGALLLLSLVASLLFLSRAQDRPNAEALRNEALVLIDARYNTLIQQEHGEFEGLLNGLYQRLQAEEAVQYSDGRFRGPRYLDYLQAIADLRIRRQESMSALEMRKTEEIREAMEREYAQDGRAAGTLVSSVQFVLKDTMGWSLRPSQIAMATAVLLSFILELTIFFSLTLFGSINRDVLRFLHEQSTILGGLKAARPRVREFAHDRTHSPGRVNGSECAHKTYRHNRIVS